MWCVSCAPSSGKTHYHLSPLSPRVKLSHCRTLLSTWARLEGIAGGALDHARKGGRRPNAASPWSCRAVRPICRSRTSYPIDSADSARRTPQVCVVGIAVRARRRHHSRKAPSVDVGCRHDGLEKAPPRREPNRKAAISHSHSNLWRPVQHGRASPRQARRITRAASAHESSATSRTSLAVSTTTTAAAASSTS